MASSRQSALTADARHAAAWDHARAVATRILADPGPLATPSARYIAEACRRIVVGHEVGPAAPAAGPIGEALELLADSWTDVRLGACSGEELFARRPNLWWQLMDQWPMGEYAQLVAQAFEGVWTADPATSIVIELGAGVGATTRRLRASLPSPPVHLIATDRSYGGRRRVDFDAPLTPQLPRADAVVATNALHCAEDPAAAVRSVFEVLKPGGRFVLAEGAPYPEPGMPWPLDIVFGACRGWYDRGGFRSQEYWLDSLRAAGFVEIRQSPCKSDRYELGGCYVAVRP